MQTSWENYWEQNTDSRFTRISWSKRRMIAILQPHLHQGHVILDAGSGSGFFSNYFISQGCKTYSLDYSEQALDITRRQTNNQAEAYLQQDLLDADFAQTHCEKFDLIFTDGLFEHFSPAQQDRIFQNFQTMCRPSGLIVTFVPNIFSFWTPVRPLFMPGIAEKPFTLAGLKQLYARNSATVIEAGGLNVLPIKFSPETMAGSSFGMLVYAIGR